MIRNAQAKSAATVEERAARLYRRRMAAAAPSSSPPWRLVIHGGSGRMERGRISEANEAEIRAALDRALDAGAAILAGGGAALDAVEAAVVVLEDDPHFNAGRGAVFTYDGTDELDAAIMDGRNRDAGAVSRRHRHPQPDQPRPRGDGEQPARLPQRARAPTSSPATRASSRSTADWFATPERRRQLEELRARPKPSSSTSTQIRHGRRGRGRRRRPCRRGHLDRRADRQALGPDRRFADHRRRHLCRRPRLRRLGHRRRRIFHPRRRRARDLRADADAAARARRPPPTR